MSYVWFLDNKEDVKETSFMFNLMYTAVGENGSETSGEGSRGMNGEAQPQQLDHSFKLVDYQVGMIT